MGDDEFGGMSYTFLILPFCVSLAHLCCAHETTIGEKVWSQLLPFHTFITDRGQLGQLEKVPGKRDHFK